MPLVYGATTWAAEEALHEENAPHTHEKRSHKLNAEINQGSRKRMYTYLVAAWS